MRVLTLLLALSCAAAALSCAAVAPPAGMRRIPGGEITMGRDDSPRSDERPRHRVAVDAFFLDETLVTVAAFRAFVARAGYRTSAERQGYGMVSVLGMREWEWQKRPGASWRAPFGADAPEGFVLEDDLPVTQVTYHDAVAYCRSLGRRLPTEAEWEYAARAGREGARFPWGDAPREPDGRPRLNYWEDATHATNAATDGYVYLSPVRAYPPNAFGMFDPVGNVWQLTADFYSEDAYAQRAREGIAHNPTGPPEGKLRVTRGGSWWCSATTCSGYGLHYRGKSVPNAPFNNVGFRCAKGLSP